MKIGFYVRSKIEGQPATVYLRFVEKGEIDFWIPTSEKVFPEHWSGKRGRFFKPNNAYTLSFTEKTKMEIERRLIDLRQYLTSIAPGLKGNITKEWIKQKIEKFYDKSRGIDGLNEYVQRFITEITSGQRLNQGKRYNPATIKNYKGFQSMFNEYQGIYTEKKAKKMLKKKETPRPLKIIDFNDITCDFYEDFVRFFNERGYSPNTIGRHISKLKVLMRESKDEGLHNNAEFTRRSFKALNVEVENVYLNNEEIEALRKLDLSESKHLEIARDVFLCGCYTAQRFSDYSRFNKNMVKSYPNAKVLEFIQTKTGMKCIVPIRHELDQILKKYDYTLPKTHEQKLNKYIKTVCAQSGIKDAIYIEEYRGGIKIKKIVAKYELIKTHTARRSGATNMKLAGISNNEIMKIGGWRTETEFMKYLKMSQEETALSLASHPFFVGNTLSVAK